MVMSKGKNVKFYSSNEVGQYGHTIFPNNIIVCLISFAKKYELVWYVVKLKESHFHIIGLVVKASWWGALKILEFFVKGQTNWPIAKRTLSF
jgi:hypothetical protein